MKQARFNLRILLVFAICGLVLFATLSVTALHAQKFRDYATQEAFRKLDSTANAIRRETQRLLEPAVTIARHVAASGLGQPFATEMTAGRADQFASFLNAIEIIPTQVKHISSAYIGHADGSFVILTRNSEKLRNAVALPAKFRSPYLRFERDATASMIVDRWSHRIAGKWTAEDFAKSGYDPRSRPWFRIGSSIKEQTWTDLYRFQVEDGYGITLVRGFRDSQGRVMSVLGVDLRLESLSQFIRAADISTNGFAFVARPTGELIAHPGLDSETLDNNIGDTGPSLSTASRNDGFDAQIFDALAAARNDVVRIDVDGQIVLGRRLSLGNGFGLDADLYIGAPLSDFTAAADSALQAALMTAALLIMIVMTFGMWVARAIAQPVRQAAATMTAVSQLETMPLSVSQPSMLAEIQLLNVSTQKLQSALGAFVRYLPRDLVRDLIERRQPIELGGSQKEITVLFTDIEGFTQFAETEPPDAMVAGLADYFDIISSVVSQTGGMVDKFVGDGVMAFWGAPGEDAEHARHACDAVALMARRLDAYNAQRAAAGLPVLRTRFGLHCGEAFVGNVGARERFGYTALGDVVNIAARLEQANKDLGTRVLASGAVARTAGSDHQFSERGQIQLRGMAKPQNVSEMLLPSNAAAPRSDGSEDTGHLRFK